MKIRIENGETTLSEVYSGVGIETDQGLFGIAQRDGGIEVLLDGETVWTSQPQQCGDCANLGENAAGQMACDEVGEADIALDAEACERFTRTWRFEVCKLCGGRNPIGFRVSDDVWQAVTRGRWDVLCPGCFDREAQAAGIEYKFEELFPVTWHEGEDD